MWKALKYNVVYRCTIIVWMALKFIFQLYFFHFRHRIWDEKTKHKWNKLVNKQAKEYRKKAVSLGGVLIKAGQFLSTRADIMPDAFIRELRGLVDKVPPIPFTYARELLEKEWGTKAEDYLQLIHEQPVASASIGQVYQAELKDGTLVAVKVQRKRVNDIFHIDFKAMKIVFTLIGMFTSFGKKANLPSLYNELIFVMERELDFEQELTFGNYFRDRYADAEGIHIPKYYDSLCTKKVLVMEWISGEKVTNQSFMREHHINEKQIAERLFDFYFDQFLHPGYFHADPHAGNILLRQDGTIVIVDFGMIGEIKKRDTQLFKRLIQGLILDDYDAILKTLDEMNFILPGSDREKFKKMLKQTIELYQNSNVKQMDSHMMAQIKDDIRLFVQDQPIQLSADYAYLGRAISIVLGVLFEIFPDIDIGSWGKQQIKRLYGGKGFARSIYKEIAKDAAQPILSFPKAALEWLQSGEKDRKWAKEMQRKQMMHHYYLVLEVISFLVLAGGVFARSAAVYIGNHFLQVSADMTCILFIVVLLTVLAKHYRFIRSK